MLRLLTLNLQHATLGPGLADAPAPTRRALAAVDPTSPAGARAVLDALASQLDELAPDVVVLTEVDHGQARSGGLDQAGHLAQALGLPCHRLAAAWAGPVAGLRRRPLRASLDGPGADLAGPLRHALGLPLQGFGNAVLSRHPVTSWHVQRLGRGRPHTSRRGPAWDPRSYRLWTASQRVMLAAQVAVPAGVLGDDAATLAVGGTHLATLGQTATRQLAAAWGALATLPGPHLLAGDLNLRADAVAATGVGRPLGEEPTFPAGRPAHRIDHVLTDPDGAGRGAGTGPGGARLVRVGGGARSFVVSDHAGTWADLVLEPARGEGPGPR